MIMPMGDWEDLQKEVARLLKDEDRKDVEFRLNLVLSELGDVAKYVTHDPRLNPSARLHGGSEDEVLAYGQLFAMLFGCAKLRGIDLRSAIEKGMENWRQADWRRVKKQVYKGALKGLSGCPGYAEGEAFVDRYGRRLEKLDGHILVTHYGKPEISVYMDKMIGVVTDEGGVTCHMANIARERNKPCVVGTSDATKMIKNGQRIRIDAGPERDSGRVYLL